MYAANILEEEVILLYTFNVNVIKYLWQTSTNLFKVLLNYTKIKKNKKSMLIKVWSNTFYFRLFEYLVIIGHY